MEIKETSNDYMNDIRHIHKIAFKQDDEAKLVGSLLKDDSAKPLLSLIAMVDGDPVGHILFTNAKIIGDENTSAKILAPLAVVPKYQNGGIGGKLINEGLERLKETGTDMVFVLGYPNYYSRFGFEAAGRQGFEAPYPIAEKNAEAWMVRILRPVKAKGKVNCAKSLDKKQYWIE
jgi:predicted N-acetyltransferase YhbS